MNTKITLSFNQEVINKAKKFADSQHISLSKLTEYLYTRITSGDYKTLDELPIAEWVNVFAEGQAEYIQKKSRKATKNEFFDSKK